MLSGESLISSIVPEATIFPPFPHSPGPCQQYIVRIDDIPVVSDGNDCGAMGEAYSKYLQKRSGVQRMQAYCRIFKDEEGA